MARRGGKWRSLYESKLKEILSYAKILEKQGFKVDYSSMPKALKRVYERDYRRIESWTKADVRLRASREVNGRTQRYDQYMHEKRSQSSKKGWVTRRAKQWLDYESDNPIWDEDNIDIPQEDGIYYPDEGIISWNNFKNSSDFFYSMLQDIEDAYIHPDYKKRNPRYVNQSNTYGNALNNLLIDLMSNNITMDKIYENVVEAGKTDKIFILINEMMFADSNSPRPASMSFEDIRRILMRDSYSPSASELEDWTDSM